MDLYPFDNENGTSFGITYRYYQGTPTYPFGFGLSYTRFAYSNLQVNGTSFAPCDSIGLSVEVTNTGTEYYSDEVVQVYVAQPQASVPVPQIRLAAFNRVLSIAPGQTVTVQLVIPPQFHTVSAALVFAGFF